ncbi:MAG: 6,7-dimethyl-8-ribityllumazine synthase [Maricaulaceae bacterium]
MITDPPRVLIVEARFYPEIADELAQGALEALNTRNASAHRVTVPGVFEIPAAIAWAEKIGHSGQGPSYDGFVALGCVIRGETSHYDYVCGESARALMDLTVNAGLAVGYGVLTVETEAQAWVRARRSDKNKGADAANAALAMVDLRQTLMGARS